MAPSAICQPPEQHHDDGLATSQASRRDAAMSVVCLMDQCKPLKGRVMHTCWGSRRLEIGLESGGCQTLFAQLCHPSASGTGMLQDTDDGAR